MKRKNDCSKNGGQFCESCYFWKCSFSRRISRSGKNFSKEGIELIDYPRSCQNLDKEYPEILTTFFKNIAVADLFFVFNQDRKGVSGYIGAATFSEMTYCLMQNLIHGKRIKIVLFKEPSEENFCFDEVDRWLKNGWMEIRQSNNLV
ncbi:hypothetical protein GCM10019994_13470 [Enterococcus raffinosus]